MMGEAAETVGLPAAAAADGRESVPPAEVPPAVPDPAAAVAGIKYGHIRLDISNSVLPLARLSATPSAKDGLPDNVEEQTRSLGCELIQLAGKLLKLPQVIDRNWSSGSLTDSAKFRVGFDRQVDEVEDHDDVHFVHRWPWRPDAFCSRGSTTPSLWCGSPSISWP